MHALLKNRLIHFAVIGAALFTLAPKPPSGRTITLNARDLELYEEAERQRQAVGKLSDKAAAEAHEQAIEDELIYQEGLRMGLAVSDQVVRRRVIQKFIFLIEEMSGADRVMTDDELRRYYNAHKDRYLKPASVSFEQVLFVDKPKFTAAEFGARAGSITGASDFLPRVFESPATEVKENFGAELSAAVDTAPAETWVGPVQSKFGWHMIFVHKRDAQAVAAFDEVKKEVERHVRSEIRGLAKARLLQRLHKMYDINIEGKASRS